MVYQLIVVELGAIAMKLKIRLLLKMKSVAIDISHTYKKSNKTYFSKLFKSPVKSPVCHYIEYLIMRSGVELP